MNLTRYQKRALGLLAVLFAIDNVITLYGVFFYGPGFYEANPICRFFLELSPWVFIGALTVLKLAGLGLAGLFAQSLNTLKDPIRPFFPRSWYNGNRWGNVLCTYAVIGMGSALAYLTYINLA